MTEGLARRIRDAGSPGPLWVDAPDGPRLACWDLALGTEPGPVSVAGTEPVLGAMPGRPLLLTHGAGLNGRSWAPVGELLGTRHLVPLALDLRGHGASGRSPGGNYDWELFAGDVLAAVDQLGLGRGDVLAAGHSAGATALVLAEARRPGTFAALWLWEPVLTTPGSDLREVRSRELAERARRRRARFASLEQARSHFSGRGMFARFDPAAMEGFLSAAFVRAPGSDDYLLACDPEDEARTFEASGTHDAWGRLGEVRCPVRVLGGALSVAVPPADVAAIAGRLPSGEAVAMAGLGHFGPFESPGEIADDISAWAGPGPLAAPSGSTSKSHPGD
jgi:pimeloyl-ACP methyl ester carboxylesterase